MLSNQWEDQFKKQRLKSATMIVCAHPVHGTVTFWVDDMEWAKVIRPLLSPYWVNGFTITMFPVT